VFRFCPQCGAAAVEPARAQRKTVSVLFCDVAGYTERGERLDPEALRQLQSRYFDEARAALERHGATVEKFIGDAVMAVFGVPRVHEDDALRAARAALDLRNAVTALGLQARIGINTGEVVAAGTGDALVTGDAVNVAARLEQAAQPGEILLGEETVRLLRDSIDAEPVEPLELKGKSEPVPAFCLAAVAGEATRPREAPLVGRKRELQALRDAYSRAEGDRSCQLFTVLGAAGVGKSRLAYEFLLGLDATVARGRCLSYGDGITYWPVVEVLKQLDTLPADPAAAASLRSLLGETDRGTTAKEIAWAFRKLLEEQAQPRPLVCVFDDLHWAEETFIDLIEHVADLSRDAPILLLCLARPELLDERPGWGGGKLNATTVLLEPLSATETEELLDSLGGADEELRAHVLDAAEGNPLFVEEMVALMRVSGDSRIAVPPTIKALLAARLDQLDQPERSVLECGAVEGRVFHRGAVQALRQHEGDLRERLVSLVRKDLIRPDKGQLAGDDAFRFRHLLIRDAAYDALPKAARVELHERFAAWLEERRGDDLVELDELLGHHLEEGARYKQELGQSDPALAQRAGDRLASAGRRALWRGDEHAAVSLLERALGLTRPIRLDVQLELDLADALGQEPHRATAVAASAAARAADAGDDASAAAARAVAASFRNAAGEATVDELEKLARAALPLLEEAQDHAALARLYRALGQVANSRGRWEDWAQAAEQALRHARLASRSDASLFGLASALAEGPRPADDALAALDTYLPESARLLRRAELLAQLGRFDEAWSLAHEEGQRLLDLNSARTGDHALAAIAALQGDHEAAARHLRRYCDFLEEHDLRALLSTHVAELGRELCMLGRHEEAEPLTHLSRNLGDEQDLLTQVAWRQTEALVRASRDQYAEAERLALEAVAISAQTDMLNLQANALHDLAEVLAAAGRNNEATAALEQALERYEQKKNLAMVAQVRQKLDALRQAH
jgi:class 3 adenylate cyclase